MNNFEHIPKDQRKKILFLSDDIRTFSGVAVMAKEIVIGTAHIFNWVSIGGLIEHPDQGKKFDLSVDTNKEAGIEDANVTLYPTSGYGNPDMLRSIINLEKPDAIMIFTDPRYWVWLFNMEHEIRQNIPLVYLNIWDNLPYPKYNKDFYKSCDGLFAISKLTENINRVVLGEDAKDKVIKYIPHGINENKFFPIEGTDYDFEKFEDDLFQGKEYDFKILYNARNIRRKSVPELIMAFKLLQDGRPQKKMALILKTHAVDPSGTDLNAFIKDNLGEGYNIIFVEKKLSTKEMNYLYNACDITVLPSCNEGWGLSLTESMMAGTPIIATVTGGMQDQMRFTDRSGNEMKFHENLGSNNHGYYKNHGSFAIPVFPKAQSIIGSIETPYIYQDIVREIDIYQALNDAFYYKTQHQLKGAGIDARRWVTSDESMMSAKNMCKNIVNGFDEVFKKFKPRQKYTVTKI